MQRDSQKLAKNRFTVSIEQWETVKKSNKSYKSGLENQIENKPISLAMKEYIKEEFAKLKR